MEKNVLEFLENSQRMYGEKTACADMNNELTYTQLMNQAEFIGSCLSLKIKPTQGVPVYMDKTCNTLSLFMGIVYAGGYYCMLDTTHPAERINLILDTIQADILVVDNKSAKKAEKLGFQGEIINLDELLEEYDGQAVDSEAQERLEKIREQALDTDPLYSIFTSGSTGVPKGVIVNHRSTIDFIDCFTETFGITNEDVIGNQAPFDFDVSVKDIYSSLKTGATLQLIPKMCFSFPTKLLDFLDDRKVTTIIWAVSALCIVTTLNGFEYKRPSSLNKIMFSGEVMPIKHLNAWRVQYPDAMFVNLYGPTEITCNCTYYILSLIHIYPDDQIFRIAEKESRIKPYYIGEKKLLTLMMKMDAEVVVMTMPDIENYHIKRSYIRKDINYVYVPHGMDSLNMTMRTGSMDHYDSVLCTGKIQKEEIEKTEEVYNLPKKELVEWGYSLLDEMREDYAKMPKKENDIKSILIAPSWQKDNIVDSCLEDILDNLKGHGYKITVRPHPQHVRHMPEKMEGLKERYKNDTDIEIQTDFSSNSTVFEADLMITDWSGIAYEYAYTTCKPVLFIDTPMKIMNPEYKKIGIEPLNIWMRYEIGRVLKLDEIDKTADTAAKMLAASDTYKDSIDRFVKEYVYNLGSSASVGAKYIIQEIQKAIKRHKEQE